MSDIGIDWERLARAETNEIRMAIIETMIAAPRDPGWSANKLSQALKLPLSNVSYHVNALRDAGLIVQTGTTPRRGAIEHFFALVL
ncbi:MAG: helix-turn-helix domain-containing protein [Solirubrobacterales bacterium]